MASCPESEKYVRSRLLSAASGASAVAGAVMDGAAAAVLTESSKNCSSWFKIIASSLAVAANKAFDMIQVPRIRICLIKRVSPMVRIPTSIEKSKGP